jgi:hypothetical protein
MQPENILSDLYQVAGKLTAMISPLILSMSNLAQQKVFFCLFTIFTINET